MNWTKVTVLTTTEGADIVSDRLIEAGSMGTMIEDKSDVQKNQRPEGQWDILDESIAERMSEDVRVSGYYQMDSGLERVLDSIRHDMRELKNRNLGLDMGKLEIESIEVADQDWASYWKQQFKPFLLGRHMLVAPSWTEPALKPGDKRISIDPGMAFGTGTHETTGLCVALVEQYVGPGQTVIDVGTGTGILAIAALLMGAAEALAIDIDPVAVRVAQENVRLNGLEGRIRCQQGDLLKATSEVADVVIANIIADVILMILQPVRAHIKDGGLFICSGIIEGRRDEVAQALRDAGYRDLDIRQQGEWVAIAARK